MKHKIEIHKQLERIEESNEKSQSQHIWGKGISEETGECCRCNNLEKMFIRPPSTGVCT